jgi:AraC family transcriptional regulator
MSQWVRDGPDGPERNAIRQYRGTPVDGSLVSEAGRMSYDIEVRRLERQDTAVVRARCAWDQIAPTLGSIFGEVMAHLGATGAVPAGGAFGRYTPRGAEVDIEAGFTVTAPIAAGGRVEAGELPGGDAAVCLHVGPYEQVAAAYEAVQAWIAEHGRELAGAPWEVYLTPPEEQPPKTEVVFPLRPAR